jgi:hypothetical protein
MKTKLTNNVIDSTLSAAKYCFYGHITSIYFIIRIKNIINKYIALEAIELLFFNQFTIYFSLCGWGCMLLCIAIASASPHFSVLHPFNVPYSMLSIQSVFGIHYVPIIQLSGSTLFNLISIQHSLCSIHSVFRFRCVEFNQHSAFTVFNSISAQHSLCSITSAVQYILCSFIQCSAFNVFNSISVQHSLRSINSAFGIHCVEFNQS